MRPSIGLGLIAVIGLSLPDACEAQDAWLKNLNAAQSRAVKNNQPIMVVFRCER